MEMDIPANIQKLPLSVISRMRLERAYIILAKSIKKSVCNKNEGASSFYPLVRNNRLYGNEYLLRKYAGCTDYLYAIIEHGLYFGNNQQKVGLKHEWELGCILTSGNYRKFLINKFYPNYYCETIGPMIHYTDINTDYQEILRKNMDKNGRTLLFFPVHGSEKFSAVYDVNSVVKKMIEIAHKKNCTNIIICTYLGDMDLYCNIISNEYSDNNIQVTSCGEQYNQDFLTRQKSMICLADVTVSNSLGTHLGYCVYLNKPHILLPQDMVYCGSKEELEKDFGKENRSENWKDDFEQEKNLFQQVFSYSDTDIVSKDQYELCDYYWGFSNVRSPEEIKEIFEKCKSYALKYLNH